MSITDQEYIERNLSGFEGDTFIKEKIEQLVKHFDIDLIIETGTFRGGSTKQFCSMVPHVITTEINGEFFNKAKDFLAGIPNLEMYNRDSLLVLPILFQDGHVAGKNVLFFLDDHWQSVCPLLQELELIAQHGLKPVIAIHDFKVPDHPELGFDTYNGQQFDWQWIEGHIEAIYGKDGCIKEYNDKGAAGAMRGIVYIYPKL